MIKEQNAILRVVLIAALVLLSAPMMDAMAQSNDDEQQARNMPLYIVNGQRVSYEEVKDISPRNIMSEKMLPADEQTIAKYGPQASNGVVIISLRYDTPASFEIGGKEQRYSNYVASMVKWSELDPIARVIIAFRVNADGSVSEREVLEASDKRLLRRVQKAMAEAPRWTPAKRDGKGVATDHVLRITLPLGKELPAERVILM